MKEFKQKEELKLKDANGRLVVLKSVDGILKTFADTKPVVRVIKSFNSTAGAQEWLKHFGHRNPDARIVKSFDEFDVLGAMPGPSYPAHVVVESTDFNDVIESITSLDVDELFSSMLKKGLMEIDQTGYLAPSTKFSELKADFVKRALQGNVKKSLIDAKIDDTDTTVREMIVKSESVPKGSMTQGQADNIDQPKKAISDAEAEGLENAEPTEPKDESAPKMAMSQGEADNIDQPKETINKDITAAGGFAQTLERQDLYTKSGDDTNPCWDGYKQIGMKTKGGKKVPNCVAAKDVQKGIVFTAHYDAERYIRESKTAGRVRALHLREKQEFGQDFNFIVETKPKK